MLLGALAHNVVVLAPGCLADEAPKLRRYSMLRVVKDVLAVSGFIELGKCGAIKRVVLNGASALARAYVKALRAFLVAEHVRVTLGETKGPFLESDNNNWQSLNGCPAPQLISPARALALTGQRN